jgi:hypothetical protein
MRVCSRVLGSYRQAGPWRATRVRTTGNISSLRHRRGGQADNAWSHVCFRKRGALFGEWVIEAAAGRCDINRTTTQVQKAVSAVNWNRC